MNMLLYSSNLPSSNKLAEASCFPRGIGAARLQPGVEEPSHFLHHLHCLVLWTSRPPGSELAARVPTILPAIPFTLRPDLHTGRK